MNEIIERISRETGIDELVETLATQENSQAAGRLLCPLTPQGQVLPGFNSKGQIKPSRSQPALHRRVDNHRTVSAG
jgi:hypothetical protein